MSCADWTDGRRRFLRGPRRQALHCRVLRRDRRSARVVHELRRRGLWRPRSTRRDGGRTGRRARTPGGPTFSRKVPTSAAPSPTGRGTLLQTRRRLRRPAGSGRPLQAPGRDLRPSRAGLRDGSVRCSPSTTFPTAPSSRVVATTSRFARPSGSPFQAALVEIAKISDSLAARCDDHERSERSARVMGWGHEGAGRLLEDLAHRALHLLRGRTEVPVTLADVPPPDGGAFICLDLTAYADPVFGRYARCAFSANQRSAMIHAAPERPFVIVLPRDDQPVSEILGPREDPARAAELARDVDVAIPDVRTDGTPGSTTTSAAVVGRFHARVRPRAPGRARSLALHLRHHRPARVASRASPCPSATPTPRCSSPRTSAPWRSALWAMGWHPRSIAGLIRSKYERELRLAQTSGIGTTRPRGPSSTCASSAAQWPTGSTVPRTSRVKPRPAVAFAARASAATTRSASSSGWGASCCPDGGRRGMEEC